MTVIASVQILASNVHAIACNNVNCFSLLLETRMLYLDKHGRPRLLLFALKVPASSGSTYICGFYSS